MYVIIYVSQSVFHTFSFFVTPTQYSVLGCVIVTPFEYRLI
jgi:hypothetical protein